MASPFRPAPTLLGHYAKVHRNRRKVAPDLLIKAWALSRGVPHPAA
jgi:hypothetical protein